MKIRWYKNGKFGQSFEDQIIDIGSIVSSLTNPWYFDSEKDELLYSNDISLWKIGTKITSERVKDIMYINSKHYTGFLIKLNYHWPWFQLTSFELD